MYTRIIPRLDIKGPNLVKGIHLEGLRILGPAEKFAAHYYQTGADELLYMDAVASLYGRNSLGEIIERTARAIFIPLTVGGGLRSIDDIQHVLRVGADRVALNTAAIERPEFIREAARKFGSSTIAVSIEAKRQADGSYSAYVDNGRDNAHREVTEWAKQAAALGAGEIIVTSVDREGTGRGFDSELVRRITTEVEIPVVACGGAGACTDLPAVLRDGRADAISVASILHYPIAKEWEDNASNEVSGGEFRVVQEKIGHDRIEGSNIPSIKALLVDSGIDCRI